MRRVAIVAAKRTPMGSFQGSLSPLTAPQLGAAVIKSCLAASGVSAGDVEEVRMGNVLTAGIGQAPARQAALGAGLPYSVPCTTIGKVCGSGMRTVMDLENAIRSGQKDIAIGGGMESMSNAPFLLPGARKGYRMNNHTVIDSMVHDGLWDPYNNMHMGHCAEVCAKHYGFTREMQDAFAMESVRRSQRASTEGLYKPEIVPVTVAAKGKETVVSEDENPKTLKVEKIPTLKPAFRKDGTITAANASSINDGAACVVLMSETKAKEMGIKPLAWIVGHLTHAQEPMWFTTAPVFATQRLLKKMNFQVSDIDLWEVNEAFGVVTMACMTELKIDHGKVNVWGGACALGHPIGCSGVRLLVTLVNQLYTLNKHRALATLCIGGGEATATIIERA